MRNHWLGKKIAKEEFFKCKCQIQYIANGFHKFKELPLQLNVSWINTTGYLLFIKGASILDKNKALVWHQMIGSDLEVDAELIIDFNDAFVGGYKVKDLFA